MTQKLQLMEALWDDLCRTTPEMPSPSWHGNCLEERQARVDRGEAYFVDWDEAKRRIRDAAKS